MAASGFFSWCFLPLLCATAAVPPPAPARQLATGAVSSFEAATSGGSVRWVVALEYETQAEACTRQGFRATARELPLAWDGAALAAVSAKLGFKSGGVAGCCTAGMWCDGTSCFTHTNASHAFVNHGWFAATPTAARPVYSCKAATAATAGPPKIKSISSSQAGGSDVGLGPGSLLTIAGSDFGSHEDGLSITFGGPGERQQCDSPQFCHQVCRSCNSGSARCRNDEVCIQDGDLGGRCVPFCKQDRCGQDSLCPCDTRCYEVLFSGSRSASYICSPRHPLSSGNICSGFIPTHNKIVCTVPKAPQWATVPLSQINSRRRSNSTTSNLRLGISFERTTDGAAAVDPASRAIAAAFHLAGTCTSDAECDDGNPCTTDTCAAVPLEDEDGTAALEPLARPKVCTHVERTSCQSLPRSALRQNGRARYFFSTRLGPAVSAAPPPSVPTAPATLLSNSSSWVWQSAPYSVDDTAADFLTSAVSRHDDKPLFKTQLGFAFPFYQERHTEAYLSPNGMLQLDAAERCSGVPFNAGCPLVASHSSVIAPFFADFDPSASEGATVRYRSGSVMPPNGTTATARFDVVWRQVPLYALPNVNYSFGASLFSDGSVSLFWKTVPGQEPGESTSSKKIYRTLPPFYERTSWIAGLLAPHGQRAEDALLTASGVRRGTSVALCRTEPVASLSRSAGAIGGNTSIVVMWTDLPCMAARLRRGSWLESGGGGKVAFEGETVADALTSFVCTFGGTAVPAVAVAGGYLCVTPPAPGGRAGTVRVDLERMLAAPNSTHPRGVTAPMELYAMDGDMVLDALQPTNTSGNGAVQSRALLFEYRSATAVAATAAAAAAAGDPNATAAVALPQCDALAGGLSLPVDRCGVCGGVNASVDCFGKCFGSAEQCGSQCTGGSQYTSTTGTCKEKATVSGCVPPIRTTSIGGSSGGGSGSGAYNAPYNRNAYSNGEGQQSLVLIAVLACTMVLLSVCMWIVRVSLVHRLRNTAAGTAIFGAPERPGLTPEQIATCTELVKDADVVKLALTPEITCSICICEFEEGETVRRLPCHHMHIFHTECIDQWFQQSRLCPMCKQDVLAVSAGAATTDGVGEGDGGRSDDERAVLAGGGAGVSIGSRTIDDDGAADELQLNRGGATGGGGGAGTRRPSSLTQHPGRMILPEAAGGGPRAAFGGNPTLDSPPRAGREEQARTPAATTVVQVAPVPEAATPMGMQIVRQTTTHTADI